MAIIVRQVTPSDAPRWLDMFKSVLGEDYPAKQVYDMNWVQGELAPESGNETWAAISNNQLQACVCLLAPMARNVNPIINLGRNLSRKESHADGSAKALFARINELADGRGHIVVARVLASDNQQQALLEGLGYICVGFQPFKHLLRLWEGVLFYVRPCKQETVLRMPLSESLPQINELACFVLKRLDIPFPIKLRNGLTGYPLQAELAFQEVSLEEFDSMRAQAPPDNVLLDVSGGYNLGCGLLRLTSESPCKAIIAKQAERVVGGAAYFYDENDRCMRVIDSFTTDDLSTGAIFNQIVKIAQTQLNAVYIEADILMTAMRLLKSAEQLGFVPIAYLPGFCLQQGQPIDVVKLVKLNLVYALENTMLTAQAQSVVEIIDRNFQDQKLGLAIINLLRSLSIFADLGDGELRKIARLFSQKLYRKGDIIFKQGQRGNEAYVVMRGRVDIYFEGQTHPIASIENGQIFGEQAFLDGAARGAKAAAGQDSILLVVHRSAFNDLAQREPHLGMVVMRNTAIELSNKLRRSDVLLSAVQPAIG